MKNIDNALLDVLFKYDLWATRLLLEECRGLTREQFEKPLGLGHGNHHRTQAIDMLRLLGVDTPMEWHPFEWDEALRGGH